MKTSIIIPVYRRYKHLYWCIKGVSEQSYKNFEVIVADDGSCGENLKQIKNIVSHFSENLSIEYVWHEDKGFRKTLILNKAVKKSKGDLLIFLDCDVLPEKQLVEKYLFYYKKYGKKYKNILLTGDALYIDPLTSEKILNDFDLSFDSAMSIIKESFDLKTKLSLWYRYAKFFYYSLSKVKYPKGYGGNMAVNREAFIMVNGFNNNYGLRGEDSDFFKRLVIAGGKRISVNSKIKSFHLHHERGLEKKDINDNKERRSKLKWSYYKSHPEIIVTPNGFNQV